MIGTRLVHLIEKHADDLAIGLTAKLRQSELTSDFCRVPAEELQKTTAELYRNLGDWLLKKTPKDSEQHFAAIAQRRASEGIRLQQFVWAIISSRNHLHQFLLGHAFADSIFELYSELELQQLLNQFFERATYCGVVAYEEAIERDSAATAGPARQIHRANRLQKMLSHV